MPFACLWIKKEQTKLYWVLRQVFFIYVTKSKLSIILNQINDEKQNHLSLDIKQKISSYRFWGPRSKALEIITYSILTITVLNKKTMYFETITV